MYQFKLVFLSLLCCVNLAIAKLRATKYVYQKDMSEHCRRRVMPSVFLGNHVVGANSQILHFSQLEVPYSCFISIRTETGGNIILVIKLDSQTSIGCGNRKGESPVKVFGMGKTFGGYWGPLPDILTTSTPHVDRFYTLKSTTTEFFGLFPEDTDYDTDQEEDPIVSKGQEEKLKKDKHESTRPTDGDTIDYIRQIIPIVNITGRLIKSDRVPERAFDEDDTFDQYYNVKRVPGEQYSSTMVPLLQFSMAGTAKIKDGGRAGAGSDSITDSNGTTPEPRFDFEYDFGAFTLDPRLKFNMAEEKPVALGKKYRPLINRRLNFKKNKDKLFSAKPQHLNKIDVESTSNDSWSYIEGLLKKLGGNKLEQDEKENRTESKRFSALLQRVADWQHNYSAYLSPNLTLNDPLFLEKMQDVTLKTSSVSQYKKKVNSLENLKQSSDKVNHVLSTETMLLESTRIIKVSVPYTTTPKPLQATTKKSAEGTRTVASKVKAAMSKFQKATDSRTVTTKKTVEVSTNKANVISTGESTTRTTVTTKKTKLHSESTVSQSLLGSMADHASWENVVQVAPKIASILSPTESTEKSEKPAQRNKRRHRPRRRKRSIQAIPIEVARPHTMSTDPDVPTTPEVMYTFEDIQDLAQLVELQDDNIQGHVALRYMRRYVGATMFDLCANSILRQTQHVLFFNSSRIVLALNNFTLPHMTVIATPARWLPFSRQECEPNSLECQVANRRVCVSKLNACDGVPNCGANDIYDEDRLQCKEERMQHNVYLAAFTFLAVLLTLLYTVHYWLKRCVPKVAEAFFVYTDGTENILYLDSIMRSPFETERAREVSHEKFFVDELALVRSVKKKSGLLKTVFRCCKKKPLDDFEMVDVGSVDVFNKRDHEFSFAEMEINNLRITNQEGVEVAVQTGSSLEMPRQSSSDEGIPIFFESVIPPERARHRSNSIDPRAGFRDLLRHVYESEEGSDRRSSENSELKMLNFLREAKLSAEHSNQKQQRIPPFVELERRETEMKNTILDQPEMSVTSASTRASIETRLPELDRYVQAAPFEQFPREPLPGPSAVPPPGGKRIRFNDYTTSMNREEDDDNSHGETSQMMTLETPDLSPEPNVSGRDFRRFWSSKGKKDKGKQKKQTQRYI